MTFYTYILQSETNLSFYTGQTQDLHKRLILHNKGYEKSTKRHVPWRLIWFNRSDSRSEAMKLELKIKNLKSRNRIIKFIKENPCSPGSGNFQISDLIISRESS